MPYHAYMLRCRDGSYYTGHTDDIENRVWQHQQGAIEGHTKTRRPVRLVLAEEYDTRDAAFRREQQLKGWSRAKKETLIKGNLKRLQVLSRNYAEVIGSATSTSSVHGSS
jgi:predicted GIY-YIG superfamily endonuclease